MTSTPPHGQEPFAHWLAARHHDLCDGLSQFLDPDAGLREIMLHAKHFELIGSLGSHLDAEAGLMAILPSQAEVSPTPPSQPEEDPGFAAAAPTGAATPPASQYREQAPAVMIGLRVRAHDLVRDLFHARDRALNRVRVLDDILDPDLELSINRARDLVRDLNDSGNINHQLVSRLSGSVVRVRDYAHDQKHDRAVELAVALDRAYTHASDLALDLGERQVDASGADLSGMEIRHLAPLNGIIWTRETTWPPGIESQVEAYSDEVRPGVYRVHLGDIRDRDLVVLV